MVRFNFILSPPTVSDGTACHILIFSFVLYNWYPFSDMLALKLGVPSAAWRGEYGDGKKKKDSNRKKETSRSSISQNALLGLTEKTGGFENHSFRSSRRASVPF